MIIQLPAIFKKKRFSALFLMAAALAAIMAAVLGAGCVAKPSPVHQKPQPGLTPQPPAVSFFYTNGRGEGSSHRSLSINKQFIDEISPLWYHLKRDGSLVKEVDTEALKLARQNGIRVIPLVALSRGGGGVLTDPPAAGRAAEAISLAVLENDYDGINIDIEIIVKEGRGYKSERDELTGLVAGVGGRIKPSGKRLDVSVTPISQPPSHLAPIYDHRALADHADRMVIMTYDYSHPRSTPGPVAPLPWVEENISAALEAGLRPEKIHLGIAAYGYDWPAGSSGGVARPTEEILRTAGERGIAPAWDALHQAPYLDYEDKRGGPRKVWFENRASAEKKLDLAKKYRLAGVSVWRLGYEEPDFWEIIKLFRAA